MPPSRHRIDCSGRTHWKLLRAPTHGLRPGEFVQRLGDRLGDDVGRLAAGLLDLRDVVVALLLVLDDLGLRRGVKPADFRKPATACSGAPTRGPFFSSEMAGDLAGTPSITSVRRRGVEKLRASPDRKAPRLQAVGDETLQVVRRAHLHAGRDFFGEKFEQKFRHFSANL